MSGPTKIEWADAVWNPVTGCTKVSAGCTNCYAARQAKRFAGRFGYPAEHPFAVTLHPDRLDEPLRWRKPRRIFVCSMSDLFHPDVPFDFIARLWDTMFDALMGGYGEDGKHKFLILTKRPERFLEFAQWMKGQKGRRIDYPGVWLGTSIEDQATADERIPRLLRCPAAVRFVSYEPPLGPVDLHSLALSEAKPSGFIDALGSQSGEFSFQSHRVGDLPSLDWVIAGGESGPKARPAHPDWFRSVQSQCQAAGVPFFFKGWGEWVPRATPARREDAKWPPVPYRPGCPDELPWAWMDRVGKKAAGRLLDGVEHNAYPGESPP
jgi:protein gp37